MSSLNHEIQNKQVEQENKKTITKPPPLCVDSSSTSVSSIMSPDKNLKPLTPDPSVTLQTHQGTSHKVDNKKNVQTSHITHMFVTLCLSNFLVYMNPFYMNVIVTYLVLVSLSHEKFNIIHVLTDEMVKVRQIWTDLYTFVKLKCKT